MSYLTPPHPCSYLPGRYATNQFIGPESPIHTKLYSQLVDLGFRRSGDYVYRPRCYGCSECIPVRIPVKDFQPNRSQRRSWRANQDLHVVYRPAEFDQLHFDLYRRYLAWRHPGGGMDNPSVRDYMGFLTSRWIDTHFHEFWHGEALACVAVVDCLDNGLSAVYTFYDPAYQHRGIGNYAILWQITAARRLGLPWVYLGYWINASPKMRYKGRFRPLEVFRNGRWIRLSATSCAPASVSPGTQRYSTPAPE